MPPVACGRGIRRKTHSLCTAGRRHSSLRGHTDQQRTITAVMTVKKGSFLLDSTLLNIPVFFHLSILYDMPPNRDFSRGRTPRIKGFYPPHEKG